MGEWRAIGPHRYQLEHDVFFWIPSGEVTAEHAAVVCEILGKQHARFGYALWLVDAGRSVPLGFEARRLYAQWMRSASMRVAVAAYNTNLAAQTTATLTAHAARLLTGEPIAMESFAQESDARAFLAEFRRIQCWLLAAAAR